MHKSYSNLKKNAKGEPVVIWLNKTSLRLKLKKLFWADNSYLKNMISKDKKRSLEVKIEDLKFLGDQEGERKFVIGSEDIRYIKKGIQCI